MIERPIWSGCRPRGSGIHCLASRAAARQQDGAGAKPNEVSFWSTCPARPALRDPEFFRSVKQRFVVLDEVHQLPDPSRLLKIAADEFSRLKILATGSSPLAATGRCRDSPTG